MIFVMVMWDVIFLQSIAGSFETPYQSAPLDLGSDSFPIVRSQRFESGSTTSPALASRSHQRGRRSRTTQWDLGGGVQVGAVSANRICWRLRSVWVDIRSVWFVRCWWRSGITVVRDAGSGDLEDGG